MRRVSIPRDRQTLESWYRRLQPQLEFANWQPDANPLKTDMLEVAQRLRVLLDEAIEEYERTKRIEQELQTRLVAPGQRRVELPDDE